VPFRFIHRTQAETRVHRPVHPSRLFEPEDDFMQILIFPTKDEKKKGVEKKKTLMELLSDASTYRAQSVTGRKPVIFRTFLAFFSVPCMRSLFCPLCRSRFCPVIPLFLSLSVSPVYEMTVGTFGL